MHRARLHANIDLALSRAQEQISQKSSGQGSLFDMMDAASAGSADRSFLPDCPPWTEKECLGYERELLGVYMTGHPLTRFRHIIRDLQTFSLSKIDTAGDNKEIRVAGLLQSVSRRISAKTKEAWAITVLDDGERTIEALVFSDVYKKYADACIPDAPVLICGSLSKRDDQPKIMVREIFALQEAPRYFSQRVIVGIKADGAHVFERIQQVHHLGKDFPGNIPLFICLMYPNKKRVLIDTNKASAVDPSGDFCDRVEKLLGRNSIKIIAKEQIFKDPRPERRWQPREGA
jgi:DNA polymerase-3 subunit alpha